MQAAGLATDHATYLLPPGTADIFFPTDFQMLERMYSTVARTGGVSAGEHLLKPALLSTSYAWLQPVAVKTAHGVEPILILQTDCCAGCSGVQSSVIKSREFMKRYASLAETTCSGGYNPLLQDFKNTSFFIGQKFE